MTHYGDARTTSARAQAIICAAEAFSGAPELRGATVLLTGATGLVGGAVARTLMYLNGSRGLNIRLRCPVRSLERARLAFKDAAPGAQPEFYEADLEAPAKLDGDVDYILHAAAPTASGFFVSKPVETLKALINSSFNLLELAREKRVRGMVYLSSMEAFGRVSGRKSASAEADLGYIDLSAPRSSYSEGKRVCELMCACYAHEYGVPVRAARLAQTFGAGVSAQDGRVFMQFVKSALAGEDLILHTKGASMGNYVHISDCVSALLTLLVRGEAGRSYSVAGDGCHLTIMELAQRTAQLLGGGKSRVRVELPEDAAALGYAPDTELIIDASALKALSWRPRFGIDDMLLSLAQDLKQQDGRLQ